MDMENIEKAAAELVRMALTQHPADSEEARGLFLWYLDHFAQTFQAAHGAPPLPEHVQRVVAAGFLLLESAPAGHPAA